MSAFDLAFLEHGDRMTTSDAGSFDLYVCAEFFDEPTCAKIVAEMSSAQSEPATVYGKTGSSGSIDERVRKSVKQMPSRQTVELVRHRLLECKHQVEQHFSISLSSCEEPQFLRYRVGDFFVAHQDGNTGMLRLDSEARRVSVVIFLSRQSATPEDGGHSGGSLVFHDWRASPGHRESQLAGKPGTLVAFRSETTHEVTPVTSGERHSIACWYR